MKILQVGIFRDHELGGCLVFEKGLLANGCEVERFDYRQERERLGNAAMNARLLDAARGKELVFIGKGEGILRSTLRDIRRSGAQVLLWYGDIRERMEE